MQQENKNDSVQLSSRYQQYTFAKQHLRGTSRPEVFPIGESTEKNIVQLNNPTHSNNRLYGEEGISPMLNTAQGGNRQPKIVKVSGDLDKRKTYLGDIASTLAANPTSDNTARLYEDSKIRRLTPKECERLQGFPDDWTKLGVEEKDILKKKVGENGEDNIETFIIDTELSDTQRYKMCGNAVTVNVIKEIVKKLIA